MLTELTEFWLQKLAHILPNHSTGVKPEDVVAADEVDQVRGRAVVVKRLKPILVEAVARGYLIGSGWKDYQATGSVCGIKLPAGLQQASQLPSRSSRRPPRRSSACTMKTWTSPTWSRKSVRKWPSAFAT